MKVTKILPLLLVAPLLASCGGDNIEVKAPEFKAYATVVDHDTYVNGLQEAAKTHWLSKTYAEGEARVSFELKDNTSSKYAYSLVRADEVKSSNNSVSQRISVGGLDVTNDVMSAESEVKARDEYDYFGTYKRNGETSSKAKAYYQEASIGDKRAVAIVDPDQKSYMQMGNQTLGEGETLASTMYMQYYMMLGMQIDVTGWNYKSEEEKARYTFYKDGNIYTYEYKYETEEEVKLGEVVLHKEEHKTVNKFQLEFETKIVFRYSKINETVTKYVTKGDENRKAIPGDVYNEKDESYCEETLEQKQVSVAKVDISTFTYIG